MGMRREWLILLLVVILLSGCTAKKQSFKHNQPEITVSEKDSAGVSGADTANTHINHPKVVGVEEPEQSVVVLEEAFITEDKSHYTMVLTKTPSLEFAEYDNISIIKKIEGQKEVTFDLHEQGFYILGTWINEGQSYYTYEDRDKDGIKEFHMVEYSFGSDLPRHLIIGNFSGTFEIMFFDTIEKIQYLDLDQDGIMEIVGATIPGGQVSYDIGFYEVFKRRNHHYYHDAALTKRYSEKRLEEAMEAFDKEKTIQNLNWLIAMCAYHNDRERAQSLLLKHDHLFRPYLEDSDYFEHTRYIASFEYMLEDYQQRWEWINDYDGTRAITYDVFY